MASTKELMMESIEAYTPQERVSLAAKWVSKQRTIDDSEENLTLLFFLDDEYNEVYQRHRIAKGFGVAQVMAYEHVLTLIFQP